MEDKARLERRVARLERLLVASLPIRKVKGLEYRGLLAHNALDREAARIARRKAKP
jgi:hypothetical protein